MKEDLTPRLEQRILDRHAVLEISEAEFATLATAKKTLVDALAFEQKFELLLGNYLDFETGATRLSPSQTWCHLDDDAAPALALLGRTDQDAGFRGH